MFDLTINNIFQLFATIAAVLSSATLACSQVAPILQTAGNPEKFHDNKSNTCGNNEIEIDAPVRVFEDQFNVIHMTVSNTKGVGYQWTGSVAGFTQTPSTAALDCTRVMLGTNADSTNSNQPEYFDQVTWIQSLYFNGTQVFAYGHQDYLGKRVPNTGCNSLPNKCWYSSVTMWSATPVSSQNRHLSFNRIATPPNHVAIYPYTRYPTTHSATTLSGWIG